MGGVATRESIAELLQRIVRDAPGERLTLGQILAALDERAYGFLMLVLALPMALPVSAIPGVSTVFGVPLCFVVAQLAIGFRRPRLPALIADRSFARSDLDRLIARALPWIARVERLVHPRWPWLTAAWSERAIGAICLLLAVIMALPIIGGNQPPGIAISLFAVGLLERDGVFVLLGLAATVVALFIVSAVIGAFIAAGYFIVIHLFG